MSLPADTTTALASELRALVGQLKRRLREQASHGDFTSSQIAVLLRLEREGAMTTSGLARREGMRPQSMGAVIAPLEAAGFIAGVPDPADGRQTLLSLTPACHARLAQARAARQDWLSRQLAARLSTPEQTHVAQAVTLLRRLLD